MAAGDFWRNEDGLVICSSFYFTFVFNDVLNKIVPSVLGKYIFQKAHLCTLNTLKSFMLISHK